MKIKWFGQSFFLITSDDGTKIVTDPFDSSIGYSVPNIEADIVTTSHNHYDHNKVEVIKGRFRHINTVGRFNEKGIEINGILTSHGHILGKNIIYTFKIDGLKVCHCGDLGHVLSPAQVNAVGEVDILIIPVGGGAQVLSAKKAVAVIKQLNPKVVIPMHYKTEANKKRFFMFSTVDKFLLNYKGKRLGGQEIILDRDSLNKYKGVIVLEYQ